MSLRSHRSLRLGALALLAAVAIWPRARPGMTAAELSPGAGERTHGTAATGGVVGRAETAAAKLLSAPRTAKLTVAEADESQLKN